MKQVHAIAVGSSAGGVESLLGLAASLPVDFPAVVLITQHIGAHASLLPELMNLRGKNHALHPNDGDALVAGTIYIAPPDRHMLVEDGKIRLFNGPKENHCRPAIDPMFRSVALEFGPWAIGVVLTGFLDDGTAGLKAIKQRGGTAVVQDPSTAIEPSMPASALANVDVDHCLPLEDMATLFIRLIAQPMRPARAPAAQAEVIRLEHDILKGRSPMENLAAIARPSALTCPDCGGGLWEINEQQPLRYRCHTGHAFSAQSLANAHSETVEHSLWSGVRTLQETEILHLRIASVSRSHGDHAQAGACEQKAADAKSQALELVQIIEKDSRSR